MQDAMIEMEHGITVAFILANKFKIINSFMTAFAIFKGTERFKKACFRHKEITARNKFFAHKNSESSWSWWGLSTFWKKKKKYTFSNKKNLWWNKNIRLADLTEASKFMISPFRSYIIRGKPQNDYLYKAALRRRLLRFHQPCTRCSISTNNGVFF